MQYKVLRHIAHNGKRYEPNQTVEMPEDDAQPLVELGYLQLATGHAEQSLPAHAIAELFAFAEVPRDDKPSIKEALKIIKAQANTITDPQTGITWQAKDYEIKADLRDEAWELYLAMLDENGVADSAPNAENSDDDIIHAIVETLYAVFGNGEKADKKPNVDDVRKWCENPDITAKQRDAAWERYLAEAPSEDGN